MQADEAATRYRIAMTANDVTIEAELENSETVRDFVALLPVDLSMRRFDEREYYARIPPLSTNGSAMAPQYENGDVTFYKGGPSFAIFFGKAGESSQEDLIRMGKVVSDHSLFDRWGDQPVVHIELRP